MQARFTQATAAFDQVSRTGAWTFTNVGDDGLQTDWERLSQPAGFTEKDGRLTVSGSGDIAPAGHEAGPTLEFVLAGVVVALVAVIVVAVLFITGEHRTGLIRTTLAAMPARGRLVAVKAAVIGGVSFVCGLVATAVSVPLASHLVVANGNYLLPTSLGTRVRVIVGAALLLSLAAILAYALGSAIRRGLLAVTVAIVLIVLPYLLATASLLPDGVAAWLLRLTPAAGFAFKQVLPAYHQVLKPYTPAEGYFPLSPWAGLGVLAVWALGVLALAAYRARRADA
ncbi:hypothetical protein ACQP2F_26035 [Actinoplanes sp. CA-030573]|uniref:hypothetical protein n=1 Tax=Actinoplanes sp. CA-030573 TaxID=3239898 RepID=UPI003D8C525E